MTLELYKPRSTRRARAQSATPSSFRRPIRLDPVAPHPYSLYRNACTPPESGCQRQPVVEWCTSLRDENKSWSSVALWAEGMLLEQDGGRIGSLMPSKERAVVLVHVLRRISNLFTRFEPVMKLVQREMLSCIYVVLDDLHPEAPPVETWSNDDLYAQTTWFEKCQLLKSQVEKCKTALRVDNRVERKCGWSH